ncbi:hypothetical protein PR048_029446 [Dryococelus australis]|uniref:Uncharacterized protein n=1 Tax=Dryococelus australis TaxID=614101 RepID=A0ABQ9GDC7_9NEOP|nr:hypothetical protein PR048_029446 [Dryococelus australis]
MSNAVLEVLKTNKDVINGIMLQQKNVDHGSLASTTPDMPDEVLEDKKSASLDSLKLSDEDCNKLCQDTVIQTQSFSWQKERLAAKSKTVLSMLYSDFSGTRSTKYGIEKRRIAIEELEIRPSDHVQRTGLWVDEKLPFVGASPDGLLAGSEGEGGYFLYCSERTDESDHNYTYQIQTQLHVKDPRRRHRSAKRHEHFPQPSTPSGRPVTCLSSVILLHTHARTQLALRIGNVWLTSYDSASRCLSQQDSSRRLSKPLHVWNYVSSIVIILTGWMSLIAPVKICAGTDNTTRTLHAIALRIETTVRNNLALTGLKRRKYSSHFRIWNTVYYKRPARLWANSRLARKRLANPVTARCGAIANEQTAEAPVCRLWSYVCCARALCDEPENGTVRRDVHVSVAGPVEAYGGHVDVDSPFRYHLDETFVPPVLHHGHLFFAKRFTLRLDSNVLWYTCSFHFVIGHVFSSRDNSLPDWASQNQDKIDVKHVYTEVDFAIGSQFTRYALDDSEPIADLQGNKRGKREIIEKTRRKAASSSRIPTFENPGATPPGIEPGSPEWEELDGNLLTLSFPLPGDEDHSFILRLRNSTVMRSFAILLRLDTTSWGILYTTYRTSADKETFGTYTVYYDPAELSEERIYTSAVSLLASLQGDPGSIPGRVTTDFRMWESCRTMPLIGRFSRDLPFPPPFHSNAAQAQFSPHLPSLALKTSVLRAVQISSLTHLGKSPHLSTANQQICTPTSNVEMRELRGLNEPQVAHRTLEPQLFLHRLRCPSVSIFVPRTCCHCIPSSFTCSSVIGSESPRACIIYGDKIAGAAHIRPQLFKGIVRYDLHKRKSAGRPHQESNPARLGIRLLIHIVFEASWRTVAQLSPSTVTANNQCAVNIGIFVRKTVESDLQVIELTNFPVKDKIDVKHVCTEVDFAIGSQFIRHVLGESDPIADLQGNK